MYRQPQPSAFLPLKGALTFRILVLAALGCIVQKYKPVRGAFICYESTGHQPNQKGNARDVEGAPGGKLAESGGRYNTKDTCVD